jgi:hypothetical protein
MDVPEGKWAQVWRVISNRVLRLVWPLSRVWYALRIETCTVHWRIRSRLAKRQWTVVVGPEFQLSETGQCHIDERTFARNLGIQSLISHYPVANNIDVSVFLEGFDAGEQYVLRTSGLDKRIRDLDEQSRSFIPPLH